MSVWASAEELESVAHLAPTASDLRRLNEVIDYMDSTSDESWNIETVRSADGSRNCFFGHLFEMAGNDHDANRLWDWFECTWATTYRIYPVNDGENPDYPQSTPKARVTAYLRALSQGEEIDTLRGMEIESMRYLGQVSTS